MSDLIRKADVLKLIHNAGGCDATDEYSKGWDELANHLHSEVEALPTAYDVDKVVERLEDIESHCLEMCDWQGQSAIESAIEIVKGGGK